jgi:L-threonylcarbamoyladenylate synthase
VRIANVDPQNPRQERLEDAAQVLAGGGVVAIPTETFYGLAADVRNPDALRRVNALKGKAPDAALLLLLGSVEQVRAVAGELPPLFDTLAERFWPGPLTLVVPAAAGSRSAPVGRGGTVAVRVPGLALSRRLAAVLGSPICGPSANRHGEPPCRTAAEVAEIFEEELDLLLDGGPTTGGAPSTILDLSGETPRILREGLVGMAALQTYLPAVLGPSV